MCGIFFFNGTATIKGETKRKLLNRFKKIRHRGPDSSSVKYFNSTAMVGFHRLQVVDPTDSGMQPFYSKTKRFVLVLNGEIYNFKTLQDEVNNCIECEYQKISDSDCEVVVHLFEHILKCVVNPKYSEMNEIEQIKISLNSLCRKLDGEFALVIYDIDLDLVLMAVDELRVRPLFYAIDSSNALYLSSEQKALIGIDLIRPVPAGCFSVISKSSNFKNKENAECKIEFESHFDFEFYRNLKKFNTISYQDAANKLRHIIIKNVQDKLNPDRDFVFLLSGGLDSSLVCGIAARILKPHRIRTFTFGFSKNAPDVVAAEKVARHIDSIHKTYIFSYEKGFNLLKNEVIYACESWDQTTIRAATAMLLGLKKIKEDFPETVVVYSGEVADELLRGYLYNFNCKSPEDGRLEAINRLQNITYFDGLRADRIVSSVSCELRLPFFSKSLLRFVLGLPPSFLDPNSHEPAIEKKLLRDAFSKDENGDCLDFIPSSVLWRTKNAMSDATSCKSGWKDFLKENADEEVTDSRFRYRNDLYRHCAPQTKEDMLYREIFDFYGFEPKCVPFKWMPSWSGCDLVDSSATVLSVYKES